MTALSRQGAAPVPAPDSNNEDQQWDVFLQRSTPQSLETVTRRYCAGVTGKRVLVTGAGGWIGSALARSIAQSGAYELVLLDTAEGALNEIAQTLLDIHKPTKHIAVLASVSDTGAVADLFDRYMPQIVFHAGALRRPAHGD